MARTLARWKPWAAGSRDKRASERQRQKRAKKLDEIALRRAHGAVHVRTADELGTSTKSVRRTPESKLRESKVNARARRAAAFTSAGDIEGKQESVQKKALRPSSLLPKRRREEKERKGGGGGKMNYSVLS